MMKKDSEYKMVIIGMGFLMGYISPCYENFITPSNLNGQVIAITADEDKIEELNEKYPFRIILMDNMSALRELHPDIILFAPPPSVAPMLTETVLKPYYEEERKANRQLPDLYAFPPTPAGSYYLNILGDDINVCNILPNMVKEINGVKLNGAEGNSYITFPNESPWPDENRERLERFFAPLGAVVDVKPQNILKVLSTLVATDVVPHVIYTFTDALGKAGEPVDCADIATLFRRGLHSAVENLPDDNNELLAENDPIMVEIIRKYCIAWYEGLYDFLDDIGIADAKITKIISRKLDIALHACQEESRELIEHNSKKHATPDGVLEQGIFVYFVLMRDKVFDAVANYKDNPLDSGFYEWVKRMAAETCRIVTAKGKRLAGNTPAEAFTPDMHALLFGLLVRNAVSLSGEKAVPVCEKGVREYARQRGNRMGLRAEKHGDCRTMLNYMAYGEWKPIPGTMDIREEAQSPTAVTRVYRCPWEETWNKLGFMEEGGLYCRYIDKFLVKGYNDSLELGLNSVQMEGDEFCEFVWNGAELSDDNKKYLAAKKEKLGDSCIKDWEYHCMHLLSAVGGAIEEGLEKGREAVGKSIVDFGKIYGKQAAGILENAAGIDFNSIESEE